MSRRFAYDFSLGEALSRLQQTAHPLVKSTLRQKNALLFRFRRRSLTLCRTGPHGKLRPQQVFRGRLRPRRGGGTELRGRFVPLFGDALALALPSLLLGGGGAAICCFLQPLHALVFACSLCLCLGILWSFFLLMTHFMAVSERAWLLDFFTQGLKPPPEENRED